MRSGGIGLPAMSEALLTRRSRFEFRFGSAASSAEECAGLLARFARGEDLGDEAFTARIEDGTQGPVAFVYSGQGGQWFAMARSLLEQDAGFAATIDEIGAALSRFGWLDADPGDLRRELQASETGTRIGETRIAQPCIFALQVGLTRMLTERGVIPAAAVGHSIGELAAAVCAGGLSLSEATRVVYWRSRCQAEAENAGAMLAVGMPPAEVRRLLAGRTDVEIAAYNGPAAVTLAGTHEGIEELSTRLEESDAFVRRLDVSVPFHCHLMDPIESAFRAGLGEVRSSQPSIALYSTVTAKRGTDLDGPYWFANIRQPVRYQQALEAMVRTESIRCFVEFGPHPSLMHGSIDLLRNMGSDATWIPTLRRQADDFVQLSLTMARLAVHGAELRLGPTDHVELPPHPFERERHWLETEDSRQARLRPITSIHPHLGPIRHGVHSREAFSANLVLDPHAEPYLEDHRAQGPMVFPGASQLELVTAAARAIHGTDELVVEGFELRRPIVVAADETASTLHRLDVYGDDGSFIIISNSRKPDAPWVEHSKGRIRPSRHPSTGQIDLPGLRQRLRQAIPVDTFYRACDAVGLRLGPTFRNLTLFLHDGRRSEFLCRVEPTALSEPELGRFLFHPAMLDAVFHSLLPVDPDRSNQPLFLAYRVESARFFGNPPIGRFWSHASITWAKQEEFEAEVQLCDDDGRVFARLEGLVARRIRGSGADPSSASVHYAHLWQRWAHETSRSLPVTSNGLWLVLGSKNHPALTTTLERELTAQGAQVVRVFAGKSFRQVDEGVYEMDPTCADDTEHLLESSSGPVAGLVHAWSLDGESELPSQAARHGAVSAARVIAAVKRRERWTSSPRLVLVTARTVIAEALEATSHAEPPCAPTHASLWGLGRVAMSEQPRLSVTLVDLSDASQPELEALAEVALDTEAPAEIALRGERRFVRWISRPAPAETTLDVEIAHTPIRQVVVTPGVVDSVAPEAFEPSPLGPEDVEVQVGSVGLNFRDVVEAMNLLPPEAWDGGLITGFALGLDAAGTVRRVGREVASVAVGDPVIGFFPHCLATRAVTHERQVTRMLPGLSMAEAAALPTPFSTADYALRDLARLETGEKILIHSAAGGVGTIAVQLALHLGAQVIATTSSEEKR